MINGKSVLAIIPARGGSKGLPGKNLRVICGKPLIAWSIERALASGYIDTTVVSTDSPEIARIARGHKAAVPFLRPAKLATDVASTYDVIRHALDHYRQVDSREFDYTVLLEPTSPLRENDDIDRMLLTLDQASQRFDSIVSLGEVGQHPSIMKRLSEHGVEPFYRESVTPSRRQDNPPAYFPFGVAYIAKTSVLLEEDTFYTRRCAGFIIQRYQNYEIDDLFDFLCVERVMQHQWRLE